MAPNKGILIKQVEPDQPSLYSAITEADMLITLLPHEYNYQDVHFQGPSNRSKIVHYYGNYSSLDNPLGKFINLHKYIDLLKFEGVYLKIIKDQNKWPNNDIMARIMRSIFGTNHFLFSGLAISDSNQLFFYSQSALINF